MRVVHPLLQPGEKAGPIQLHMPVKTRTRVRAAVARTETVAPVEAPADSVPVAPPPAPAPPRTRHVAAVSAPVQPKAAPAPAQSNGYDASYGSFGAAQGAAGLDGLGQAAPPRQVARAAPAPANTPIAAPPSAPGLTKRSVILFAAGASDPAQSALGAIKFLAGDLNTAMTSSSSRIQILAYGGDKGDKGSDARRLSLKRALAIRQVLIDDGVASERIDVRAMGGADDGGPADRVDVYVKV
jgi:outer membrane protein OmpA-like peptidoglycan-associated protein